ncbi:MAG TPA: hypothetical protein VHR16_08210 [Candidatus Limnocylindrales bacterium]|nr:hypothetical protein [Candidatus Limnocylindrales bacterium]
MLDADITRAADAPARRDDNVAGDPDDLYVSFDSRISIRDVADLVFTRATHSTGAQGIAGFLMTMGLLGAVGRIHPDLWVPPLILSIAIGTGFLLLPFIWWSYLSAPELLHEKVEADTSGMLIQVAGRTIRHPWTVYRTAQETHRLFIFTSRVVRPLMFTKRELPAADADAFRAILTAVGLLRAMDEGPRYRTVLAFVLGGAVAIGVLFVAGAIHL